MLTRQRNIHCEYVSISKTIRDTDSKIENTTLSNGRIKNRCTLVFPRAETYPSNCKEHPLGRPMKEDANFFGIGFGFCKIISIEDYELHEILDWISFVSQISASYPVKDIERSQKYTKFIVRENCIKKKHEILFYLKLLQLWWFPMLSNTRC